MWDFIKQNWGNLASVAGLIISVFTLLFAKRASQAAKEAKAAVLRRNVADDLQEAARRSQELVGFPQVSEWKVVRLKADELQAQTSWLISRWGDKLDLESRSRLTRAKEQLRSVVAIVDEVGENNISEKHRKDLLRATDQARESLVEEHGKFLARIE